MNNINRKKSEKDFYSEILKKSSKKNEFNIFREQVEEKLKKLSREEVVRFAWRCAIRALPFLGIKGNFDFWKEEEQQKNLQAVFYAIDVTITNGSVNTFDSVSAAFGATYTIVDANYASSAAYAAYFAVRTTYTEQFGANDASYASFFVVCAAVFSYYSFDYLTFFRLTLDELQSGIVADNEWHHVYVTIWPSFEKTLKDNGCSYWAEWYSQLFKNGLVLDKRDEAEIVMRLNIPQEIRDGGAAEVAKYIINLKEGAERLNEARILILGDKGAGKTCLARRLKDPDAEMTKEEESTPGVDTSVWKLEKENVNVHLWDFAGHTVTHSAHQFFLSERCLYIIVFDGRNEGNNRWEYWLDHMKNYGKDSKAIILVNQRDAHVVEVPINKLREQYPILNVWTFSIRDDKTKLEEFRQMVADYITNKPLWSKQLIPASSYKVKKELEKLFNNGDHNGQELIEREEFDVIAKQCTVEKEKIEGLLSDLHALGISLWYKDMEKYNTMVLNPEWISNGVYRIINWVNNHRKHCLKIGEFAQVFEKEAARYPEKQYRFLFDLMKKYELAYEAKEKDVLIIPRLLHEDQPANMPQFPIGESLMARYKADQPLMPDTISRFIVRHNDEIKTEGKDNYLVWRSGVILEEELTKTIALVRETDDRTITVSVKGPNKTEYLSTLRETLNTIFEGYKSKKPELQYRVQRYGEMPEEIEKQDPLWLTDRKIFNQALDNIPYYDDSTRQSINLSYTVNNYHVNAQTLLSGTGNQYLDKSIHNTFNFKDCNINLQGNLNDLSRQLTKVGKTEEANELKEAAALLAEAEGCTKPQEIKKKGIAAGLQRFAEKLGDENSSLCKSIKGIEKGISVAQDIAKGYNSIAQWVGLAQIPNVFLKK